MAENEVVVENNVQPEPEKTVPEKKKKDIKASAKEWFRKKIVSLKRKPQMIALLLFLVTSLIYIFSLNSFSEAIIKYYSEGAEWCGHAVFVNTLFSILILVLFLNSFPKRKKPNLIFVALVFVFAIVMALMDVLFYIKLGDELKVVGEAISGLPCMKKSMSITIVHLVFLGISMILLATLPLYKKLILKINTSKKIETSELKESIDVTED